ncbi:MAG: DegT/DnrJ/EryC1/StrS family aminotransferase [Nocardioides sp.]
MTQRADHPDQVWADGVRAALDYWLSINSASPTSAITGGGAIAEAERRFSALVRGRPALLLPNATSGLRVALQVIGVGQGDEVLVPEIDWPATRAAVLSLGAVPVPVPVDAETLTIDPRAASASTGPRTRCVVACHLHGVCADVPRLRQALPGLPVLEDCAGALGSTLDGVPAGVLGDLAVFSFGPGKTLTTDEGGMLVAANPDLHSRAVSLVCHPIRQVLAGLSPDPYGLSVRPARLTAVLLVHALASADLDRRREDHASAARLTPSKEPAQRVLGADGRRGNASGQLPTVMCGPVSMQPLSGASSGAQVLPGASAVAADLLRQVRLLPVIESSRVTLESARS